MKKILLFVFVFLQIDLIWAQSCPILFHPPRISLDPYTEMARNFELQGAFGDNHFNKLLELAEQQKVLAPVREDFEHHQGLPRHQLLRQNSVEAISKRKEGQYIILHQGVRHALELFESLGGQKGVGYLFPDPNVLGALEIYERVHSAMQGSNLNADQLFELRRLILTSLRKVHADVNSVWFEKVVDLALRGNRDALESYIRLILQNSVMSAALYHQKLKPSIVGEGTSHDINALVLGDMHFLPLVDHLRKLPSALELKRRGVHEVILYIEGVKAGRDYAVSDLQNVTHASIDSAKTMIEKWSDVESYFLEDPALKSIYQGLQIPMVTDPATHGIAQHLAAEYIQNGIRVVVRGLE